jgi:hypothetical protein
VNTEREYSVTTCVSTYTMCLLPPRVTGTLTSLAVRPYRRRGCCDCRRRASRRDHLSGA